MYGNDSVIEQVVKRGIPRPAYYGKIAFSFLLVGIGDILTLVMGRVVSGPIVFIIGVYMFLAVWGYGTIEYEYIFINGDVEIAGIYKASKRREFFHFDFDHVIMIAPADSPELGKQKYQRRSSFCSKKSELKQYGILAEIKDRKELIIIEPDERSLAHIRMYARNKCYDMKSAGIIPAKD